MFRHMSNRIRMAAFKGWDSTFDRLDLVITDDDILRDLVRVPRMGNSTTEMNVEASG